jgi:hypothetical protein
VDLNSESRKLAYNPHRVAWQFGLAQGIPVESSCPSNWIGSFLDCWSCKVPRTPSSDYLCMARIYSKWWFLREAQRRSVVASCLGVTLAHLLSEDTGCSAFYSLMKESAKTTFKSDPHQYFWPPHEFFRIASIMDLLEKVPALL